jgi:nicotinamide-nucleotide amidase
MAAGVRLRLRGDVGVATTGVAGPTSQDGVAPGRVYVAAVWSDGERVERLDLAGGRAVVRAGATDAGLRLLRDVLTGP